MTSFRPLSVRGKTLGNGREPAVCLSLMTADLATLDVDLGSLVALAPDVIEWRVDHFRAVNSENEVFAAASRLRAAAGERPLIFTLRSEGEGGAKTDLEPTAVGRLLIRAAESKSFEFIDVELSWPANLVEAVIDAAHQNDVQVIVSSHHFDGTPSEDEIIGLLARAVEVGADVAKVAVMPDTMTDVIRLLSATERAARTLPVPLITMAMGSLGVVTRVFGSFFGSALTFAASEKSSAPGQLPIETLREILETVRQLEK
ncbi:MAG: type I 3-dehydroquinate dehydratase [Gammaproteobacteria bacterium]